MKIAVLGAGNVGGTLGGRWAELGHTVTFGLREGSSRAIPAGTTSAPLAVAVSSSEVVALAVPWPAVPETLKGLPLAEKALLDCTNPIGAGMKIDVGPGGESAAERIAAWAPGARVVKVFNTTGFGNMADPHYGSLTTFMPYAGDDTAAKVVARQLAEELGFDAVDVGGLVKARELEHMAMLWIGLAMGGMGRDIAFAVLRR
jgi:predicted dinucleotide-binding enzyme